MLYTSLPATPVFGLRREIDRLFDETFARSGVASPAWSPATDIHEDDHAITIEMELPGISPDKVEVTAEDGVLTVKGEKHTEISSNGTEARWHVVERVRGAFKRSFQLRGPINEKAVEASYANGVLSIRVPKAALPQPTKIRVKSEEAKAE